MRNPRSAIFGLALAIGCSAAASDPSPTGSSGTPSGPVTPVPATLWQPAAGSTPAKGSYAYVEMDASFSPGVQYPRTIVAVPGAFSVSVVGGRLTIVASDSAAAFAMNGVFQTMIGLTQLQEGYYGQLRGLSQADALFGGLDVALDARSCDSLAGWFAIDHVFYFNGLLTALDLRFEERCSGFAAPMHGKIHWTESFT